MVPSVRRRGFPEVLERPKRRALRRDVVGTDRDARAVKSVTCIKVRKQEKSQKITVKTFYIFALTAIETIKNYNKNINNKKAATTTKLIYQPIQIFYGQKQRQKQFS